MLSSSQNSCVSSATNHIETFPRRLQDARFSANLTQAELAERLNCSKRSVQEWEAGRSIPRPRHRRRLAAFLDEAAALDGKAA